MIVEGVQVEGIVKKTLQLQKMGVLVSSGRGSSRITTGIPTNTKTIGENTEMA